MPVMDLKKAYSAMKKSPGKRLNMWFCAQGVDGKPVLLVAPEGKKIDRQEMQAVLAKAKKREACKGEIEINSSGALTITPIGTKPGSLEMGVKLVARENQLQPTGFVIQKEQPDPDEAPLKAKALDPHYEGENEKRAWRADLVENVPDEKGGLRPATPEDRALLRETTDRRTRYADEQGKQASAVDIDGGKLLDRNQDELDDGKHGFVLDPESRKLHTFEPGKITTNPKGDVLFEHHSTPLGGKAVGGAGHITTASGRVVSIDDASGHYKPSAELTLQVVRELAKYDALRDTTVVDAKGYELDEQELAEWREALDKLAKGKVLLEKYEAERKSLSGKLLKFGDKLDEKETTAIKASLDSNAKKVEKLCDALEDARELVRGVGPANRSAKVSLQGKVGLSEEQFESCKGDLAAINKLLRKVLSIDHDLLPSDTDVKTLGSRPALNLKIGELTKLTLSVEQFEQTEGNEKQARLKSALNDEITRERREKKAAKEKQQVEEAANKRKPLVERLKELGFDEYDTEKAMIHLGVPSSHAEYMPPDLATQIIMGTMSPSDAVKEMDARGW